MNRWDCVLKRLPSGPVIGAEIGVAKGVMSQELLKRPETSLWLVDIYDLPKIPGTTRLEVHSVAAARDAPDSYFDFVFLDADHTYEGVKRDIEAWRPKVKPGGWLCGHDYGNPKEPEVARAVDEFCPDRELDDDFTWFLRI